jgi:glutaredoxin
MDVHGIAYNEINIEQDPKAAHLVMKYNDGKRRVPTLHIGGAYYGNPPLRDLGRLLGV